MKVFRERLAAVNTGGDRSVWIYVPYDQLSDRLGPLSRHPAADVGVVMVESRWKPDQRPYHKQKLALLLSNQRQFALEQARRGVRVIYLAGREAFAEQLRGAAERLGPLQVMRPAERELREHLRPLFGDGTLVECPHEGWLTTSADFEASRTRDGSGWRMDAFYRRVRQRTGLLMDDGGRPEGGKYSHDKDNREPWRGDPAAPAPLVFAPDAVTREVCAFVDETFEDHMGQVIPEAIPSTHDDAEALWAWALTSCMPLFGPYEDAMSLASQTLFHTCTSSLLHLHRLLPSRVVADAVAADVRINSKEGFVRQVLGWREFVHHVHEATDGFRRNADGTPVVGDRATRLGAHRPLPPAYWGKTSGLRCLDDAVEQVHETGYTHHIPRLMVLANWATLLDVDPEELNHWFWVGFVDAYDWVVEPNVLAMGTFGVGDVMTTKPYVSGSAYINKMSDACEACAFGPKTCPMTSLYWSFLARHEDTLSGNHRMRMIYGSFRRRSEEKKRHDEATFAWVSKTLAAGEVLTPDRAGASQPSLFES